MRRLLMRGGMSPLDNFAPETVLRRDSIGGNSGNMLYAYGVYRTLFTEDTVIDMDYYAVELNRYTDEDIARINQTYDAYICPLADAFRESFENKLLRLADFFDKLTIPCYVIGVGIRAPYEPETAASRKIDDAVKRFMKAALNKSSIVGLRGEITGEYLKHLGFRADVDFTPIGCPSMYSFGNHLTQRPLLLTESSTILFNGPERISGNLENFLLGIMKHYKNYFVIRQDRNGLHKICYGVPNHCLGKKDIYQFVMQEGRFRIFINMPTWLEFLQGADLCLGGKMHGNVAAILSGCPSLLLVRDGRMRELAMYHKFPQMPQAMIEGNNWIENLVERVDMKSHLNSHEANFRHFLSFLDQNQIRHIYRDDPDRREAPLDAAMAKISYQKVVPLAQCGREELLARISCLSEDFHNKAAAVKRLEQKSRRQQAALNELKRQVRSGQPSNVGSTAETPEVAEMQAMLETFKKHPFLKKIFLQLNH